MELIVTIVNKGYASDVIDAATQSGSGGATVLHGRGSGIHEHDTFFNIVIEPEKEIVLVLVTEDNRDKVLSEITKKVELDKPGNGIAFVLDVKKIAGMPHLNMPK